MDLRDLRKPNVEHQFFKDPYARASICLFGSALRQKVVTISTTQFIECQVLKSGNLR
jgi:hypothetical protein